MKGRKIIMVKSEIKTYGYNTSKYFPKNSRDITDGKEIDGYDVKIITGWKSDGTPISVMRDISPDELDPLIPYGYNSSDGFHWSDVDSDGIPDIVESMLSNASYFLAFYNFTHKDDWLSAEREKLWDDYNWTISYYFSLKLHKNYDKIYSDIESNPEYYIKHYNSLSPHNESCGENATKYLTSQFNPFVVENMPPVIVKFDVNFTYYGVTAKMQVYAVVRDAGAIKKVKLIDSDLGQSVEWNNIHKRVIYISHTFLATPWGANLGANITIKTWDMRDDYAKMSHVVYGPEGVLIKMFLDWLAPFLRVLGEAWKAVQKAFNIFLAFIESLLWPLINRTLSPLFDWAASLFVPLMIGILGGTNVSGNNVSVNYGKISGYLLQLKLYISMIGLILLGLGIAVGLLLMTFPIAGAVILGILSLGLAIYTYHIFEEKYKNYTDAGSEVGTGFSAVKNWLEGLSTGAAQWTIILFEIFVDLLLAPVATMIAAEKGILPEKAVADCFGTFIWAVVIDLIFGAQNFTNETTLFGWGLFAITTELLAIGVSGYGLAAIYYSKVPRLTKIPLYAMFGILIISSTLGLLAAIGKMMKGVRS